MADDFSINESGEIIRKNVQEVPQTEEEKLMAEYSQLEYEIHHLTRPTKSPEKIARYEELKKILIVLLVLIIFIFLHEIINGNITIMTIRKLKMFKKI